MNLSVLIRLSAGANGVNGFVCDSVSIKIEDVKMCSPWFLLLIIPTLFTCVTAFKTNSKQSVQQEIVSYRLPNETFPEHYAIHLTTNIHEANFAFTGRVEITIGTREDTSTIVVHARQLVINSVKLWNTLTIPTEIEILPFDYSAITEFVTITLLNGVLQNNQRFLLIIEYNGELREDNLGFYRSSYRDVDGQLV